MMTSTLTTRRVAHTGAVVAVLLGTTGAIGVHPSTSRLLVSLMSTDASGDGTALIVGASGLPIPPQGYVDNALSLYINPLSGGVGSHTVVPTPESFWPLTGINNITTDQSIERGGEQLYSAIQNQGSEPVWVFGYSQGADVETTAMQKLYASDPDANVHFVMLGDPANPDGGLLSRYGVMLDGAYPTLPALGITFSGPTPANDFPTDIYTIEYDGFADQPRYPIDFLSDLNALFGMGFSHGGYLGLTPEQISDSVLLPVSDPDTLTNYHMIPSEILPLLAPLQFLPVVGKPLYDLLEPDMRILVNLGYGSITQGWDTGPADVGTTWSLFPDMNWGDVLQALGTGLSTGFSDAWNDISTGDLSYGKSIMDVPALHMLLASAYNVVGGGDSTDVSQMTGDQLWSGIVSTLGADGTGFQTIQNAFPGMIPDPPTSLLGAFNDLMTNVNNDFATVVPLFNTVAALFTSIPAIAGTYISQEAGDGNLLGGVGEALAAVLGLGPMGLGVGTVVPVVEALAINALNFVELFDPNALQDLAGLLSDIP